MATAPSRAHQARRSMKSAIRIVTGSTNIFMVIVGPASARRIRPVGLVWSQNSSSSKVNTARSPSPIHFRICETHAGGSSIHVALISFVRLELFDVLVRLLLGLAALLLNDFPQRCIDVLGHAPCVAAYEEVRAFGIEPFPDLSRVFQHFVLHVRFVCLVA